MRNILMLLFIVLLTSAFIGVPKEDSKIKLADQHGFAKGELLEFKIHFGIFTVGKANMEVHPQLYRIQDKSCYKMDVNGWTTGAIGWVAKVDDNWGAYVDSANLLPYISWRNIKEGKYRKNELVNFNHQENLVETQVIDNKTGKFKDPLYYHAPDHIRDIIGGFMYMRSVDFSTLEPMDTIRLDAFFEDTIYDFRIMYLGKDKVKTKVGEVNALKLMPLMPANKVFDGENAITMWLSDDINKVLLKAEANMFIGKAGIELIGYQGLKDELNFHKKS